MKHLVIISGKGGTGKTTLTASFCALARQTVCVDCDVDAADIFSCEGCGLCAAKCPAKAITMRDRLSGKWFISDTAFGPLVHAELGIGEENSGKLVSKIKEAAFDLARERRSKLLIADGPPGTGCPVMASLSGADLAVIVTEPTLPAMHDMKRAAQTAAHFNIRSAVIINKWDINHENAEAIEAYCRDNKIPVAGRISFSQAAGKAISAGIPLVQYGDKQLSDEITAVWLKIQELINAA